MIESFTSEFQRYRLLAEKALAQVPDDALNSVPLPDGNSMAMLVRHISGNLTSRFTDFLSSDGEKPWRNRDEEFKEQHYSRQEMDQRWRRGWDVLEAALAELTDADLSRTVHIRGVEHSVHDALARALAHIAYHVGQMVLLARMQQKQAWQTLSVPKGGSAAYNANPTRERRPE